MVDYISHSTEDTKCLAAKIGKELLPNSVLCFFGDLGAGKTTFIKGLVVGIQGGSESQVTSPTFTYLNIYNGIIPLYHFDLYRLRDADEFLSMGFEEMFDAGGICCIEWSERIESILPSGVIEVHVKHLDEDARQISIHPRL